ncbi:MAG TPA: YggU family protein [Gammaproteobacteria bacterium]|nr:YggU family protein [Gammaproteobacteria bacterium]
MFFHWVGKQLYLDCRVQPKSNESSIAGVIGDNLKIRLTAAPSDGKANKQLIRFLSKQFQVKQSAITIVSGHTSRLKRLCIDHPNSIPESLKIIQVS